MSVVKCDYCGKETDWLPYACRRCGGNFCDDHRLPEKHECPGLERAVSFNLAQGKVKSVSVKRGKSRRPSKRHTYQPRHRPRRVKIKSPRFSTGNLLDKLKTAKGFSVFWVLFILVLGTLESIFKESELVVNANNFISALSFRWIFYIISAATGIYLTFQFGSWLLQKLPSNDFGIWLISVVSKIFTVVGIFLFIVNYTSIMMLFVYNGRLTFLAANFMAFLFAVCAGITMYSAYLGFLFKRRAGSIHFLGRF